jgi:hypothetical protein
MKDELAAITNTAPIMSSRCERSRRGRRRSTVSAITIATAHSEKFHKKIIGQRRCSEIHPPSAGPLPPAVINAMEK